MTDRPTATRSSSSSAPARRTRRSRSSTRSRRWPGRGAAARWTDVAVLYRKHKHREAIVARLRDEDIPYTVVGGLCLFETPEIRDLEQALRAIADPHDDVALVRMMTAGPWRLDALEILRVSRMAKFDRAHLLETIKAIVASRASVEVDTRRGPPRGRARRPKSTRPPGRAPSSASCSRRSTSSTR